jgi:drug/metabolite transporter (DMT)-like permease
MSNDRDGMQYLRGSLYGLAAVSIWSGWIVVARLGLRTSLTPWDIAALRFGVAGLILLPYVFNKGLAFDRLGWVGLAAIVLGGAAPVFFANWGLLFAPAAHAGALFPGVMPLMVALLAAALLREQFTSTKKLGFAFILGDVLTVVWGSGSELGSEQNIGHGLFLCAALAWAFYTVAMRKARLDGLHAAALSAVGSMFLYLPIFALMPNTTLAAASWSDLGLQAFVQGVLTAIRLPAAVWPRRSDPRRVERRSLRRAVPGDDRAVGNPDPRRVAEADRLDGDRSDFGGRLSRQRRAAASMVPMICGALKIYAGGAFPLRQPSS